MDEEEIPGDFRLLCAAVVTQAIADACCVRAGALRLRGIEWALANRRPPRTGEERAAAVTARAWLAGAAGPITAEEACQAVGVRLARVIEVVLGQIPLAHRRAA